MRLRVTSARTRVIAWSTAASLVAQLLAVPAYASEPAAVQVAPGRATAENMQIAFSAGVVTITYDLVAPETQGTLDVTLEVSTNGGQTYDVQPRSMSGDVGRAVSAGPGKRVVWEAGKDVESLQTDQFRFRVVIQVVMRSENPPATPPAESSPGVQLPTVTPPSVSPQGRQASTGNRLLWPGLALFGAGGALAGLASAGSLRSKTEYVGFYELTPNRPALYGGIGVAATGLVLLLLGRRGPSNAVLIVPRPGGVTLSRSVEF